MNKRFMLVIVLSAVVYTANFWGTSIYILDEAKNAGCAMEMYQREDWIVPTFNGTLRTDKPPLHYYFMRAGYRFFGINPFAARFFSVLMGILTVITIYSFVKKMLHENAAFITSLILVSSIQLAVQFHLAVPDPYLIFFLTLGWLSFIYAYRTDAKRYYYLFYVAISLATLAKGPVAIVFSGLIVLIFLITQKKFSIETLMRIKTFQGILVFLVIVLPWYIAVGIQTQGEWLQQFFFKHNVGRFTAAMEGHSGFPLASFFIAVAALMPFSFFFPQAFKMIWYEQKKNAFLQFCLIAMSVVIVFFAFSRTILPSYPEPAIPFFAILLGFFFAQVIEYKEARKFRLVINAIVYLVVAIALPLAAWFALKAEKNLTGLSPLAIYFVLLPLGAGTALYCIIKNTIEKAIYVFAATAILFMLIFFYILFPNIDQRNPVVQSIPLIETAPRPVVCYKGFNPAYVFALRQPIKEFESADDLLQYTDSVRHCYIITQKKYLPELENFDTTPLYEGKDLFEKPTTIILKPTHN